MATKILGPRICAHADKVKFTVLVRGQQWSSARHVHETLDEFARVIQRNARRLDFIGETDRIQRLQLAKVDGSELEELDVDATLEDVIICMGNKNLVAMVIPGAKSLAPSTTCQEAEKLGPSSPLVLPIQPKPKLNNDSPNSYGLQTPTSIPCVQETDFGPIGLKTMPILLKKRATTCEPRVRGLKITIPSSDPSFGTTLQDEKGELANNFEGKYQGSRDSLVPAPNTLIGPGVVVCKKGGPVALMGSKSAPSPAELAHFLVKGSSLPMHQPSGLGTTNNSTYPQFFSNTPPIPGFQSFASSLLSRLPVIPPSAMACSPPTDNMALLAQFLASQLREFVPINGCSPSPPDSGPLSPCNKVESSTLIKDGVPSHINKVVETFCCYERDKPSEDSYSTRNCQHTLDPTLDNGSNKSVPKNVKGLELGRSHVRDDTSSSANVNITTTPSNDIAKSETTQGRSELIFLVNRRSKTGIGAHHLKLSDLSVFFHLSVVDAAKKLGVSQTTLKKACRKFGLKRWPGRKVRSLESTIHGLEHTIAIGQGTGLEQLTEAYMRSEVTKLQQEMDQLVHGSLVEHSPMARTADLYKRLYSRGWRSKYHSPCAGFDLDLNMETRDGKLSLSFARKKSTQDTIKVVATTKVEHCEAGILQHDKYGVNGGTKQQTPLKCCKFDNFKIQKTGCHGVKELYDFDGDENTNSPPCAEAELDEQLISSSCTLLDNMEIDQKMETNDTKPEIHELFLDEQEDFPQARSPKRAKVEIN